MMGRRPDSPLRACAVCWWDVRIPGGTCSLELTRNGVLNGVRSAYPLIERWDLLIGPEHGWDMYSGSPRKALAGRHVSSALAELQPSSGRAHQARHETEHRLGQGCRVRVRVLFVPGGHRLSCPSPLAGDCGDVGCRGVDRRGGAQRLGGRRGAADAVAHAPGGGLGRVQGAARTMHRPLAKAPLTLGSGFRPEP